MKKFLSLSIFALIVISLSQCTVRAESMTTVDRILVVVNDEIITESDLRSVLDPILARLKASYTGQDLVLKSQQARAHYLNKLVDEKLIVTAARQAPEIQIEDKEVDAMIEDIRAKFPTREAYEKMLRKEGLSYSRLRERFRDELIKQKMIEYKVLSRVAVSPGEVSDYYNAHSEEFKGKAEALVTQILIRTGQTRSDEAAKEIAMSLVRRLDEGDDIVELAKEFSEGSEAAKGGDMGWIKKGQFTTNLDKVIFELNNGEYSYPVKSPLGYHIFRVSDKKAENTQEFEEVRNQITEKLRKMALLEKIKEWTDSLRKDAYISYQG